jgi:hypothetical protein
MTRHVLDRPREAGATRTRKFLSPDRREGLHPATQALVRRKRSTGPARTDAFLKIARAGTGKV